MDRRGFIGLTVAAALGVAGTGTALAYGADYSYMDDMTVDELGDLIKGAQARMGDGAAEGPTVRLAGLYTCSNNLSIVVGGKLYELCVRFAPYEEDLADGETEAASGVEMVLVEDDDIDYAMLVTDTDDCLRLLEEAEASLEYYADKERFLQRARWSLENGGMLAFFTNDMSLSDLAFYMSEYDAGPYRASGFLVVEPMPDGNGGAAYVTVFGCDASYVFIHS